MRSFSQLRPGSGKRPESEPDRVSARSDCDRAKEDVGAQDFRRLAVHLGEPPGVPEVVEDEPAAVGAVGFQGYLGVAVADDACAAGAAGSSGARRRRALEQHGGAQIGVGPGAIGQHAGEVSGLGRGSDPGNAKNCDEIEQDQIAQPEAALELR